MNLDGFRSRACWLNSARGKSRKVGRICCVFLFLRIGVYPLPRVPIACRCWSLVGQCSIFACRLSPTLLPPPSDSLSLCRAATAPKEGVRATLLRVLREKGGALKPDDFWAAVQSEDVRSRTFMKRTLNLMRRDGLIAVQKLGTKRDNFSYVLKDQLSQHLDMRDEARRQRAAAQGANSKK